jgi:hypothetical protein
VDELPAVFDAAVPQWAEYFRVPAAKVAGSRWQAYVIDDRELFAALDLLPAANPEFKNGFATDWELWLVDQPSDYYRRHLLLHEGTHAFMESQLGGCGPGWYKEGVAELLGTHEWRDGRLKLGVFPANKNDFPMWGRIKLIRDALAEGKALNIYQVLELHSRREMSTDQYAWVWALAAMLHHNPRSREALRNLSEEIPLVDIADLIKVGAFGGRGNIDWEWQTFVSQLDYGGYDFERMDRGPRGPLGGAPRPRGAFEVDRGWQLVSERLLKGNTYRIKATGRYQIAGGDQPWMCEPGGVTIEYHDGKPLGMLLGALSRRGINDEGSFARPIAIGLEATIKPERDCSLYVRVNEAPRGLADNRGEFTVQIEEVDRKLAPGQ